MYEDYFSENSNVIDIYDRYEKNDINFIEFINNEINNHNNIIAVICCHQTKEAYCLNTFSNDEIRNVIFNNIENIPIDYIKYNNISIMDYLFDLRAFYIYYNEENYKNINELLDSYLSISKLLNN